ncbi:uncharacterized protein LOC109825041 isoform X2 [Asparagus officinalis]|uniref:uncharacterized protein LOC109825041 isoform X2 n=1 Tax=Asparagus officinalis TaxID=4686 RepID=UPI00098E259F|nr:uncharacterized protein LOC109825041 isoform X2 [Asparagus officinalis]
MKSRSHRLTPSDPPDDWANGSWTVDCSCGVTFDDGEEMVSCDECGVWVHTRCSRFVKGEANFACHNCKKNQNSVSSSKKPSSTAIDTEESEVAQLLIELPTKTDPCLPPNPFPGPAYRAPFRLWAEVPMEDRVHVQGVPGGDPSLFQGISSSVFSSELWRCTGYVPKKFNFQYREFPSWEEDGGENTASRGADVLFSLSKEIVPSQVPVRAFERKQENEKVLLGSRLQSWGKKERNKLRVFSSHSSKRRKEEMGEAKEKDGKKKKPRSDADRVAAEFKKRVSVTLANIDKAGLSEDGGLQDAKPDIPSVKSEERKEDAPSQHNSGDQVERTDSGNQVEIMDVDSKLKHVLVIKASKGGSSAEVPRQKNASEVHVKVRVEDGHAGILSEADASAASQKRREDEVKESVKEEDLSKAIHDLRQSKDESNFQRDPNGPEKAKPLSSSSCQRNEKMNLPVTQPPSELSNNSNSMHPPTSVNDANTLSDDQQESSKAVNCLKQSKDESDFDGVPNNSTQAKLVSSVSSQKNEKLNPSIPQPPSKRHSHSTSMHPPTCASAITTLSDEELALLLHQELNSSPRVPRVPRMRQASGMQLTSQSAPSMLSKRSSHSAGKDQVFRRKNKEEASRDGSHNSHESIDETKKAGRAMSIPDRRCRESSFADGSAKKDSRHRSPDTAVSLKKNTSCAFTEGENASQSFFEASRQNVSSVKGFPKDASDDKTTRTLPGLINEILSKQKCSSYKELCDAVRPHWHNVRKPNGDRYAYSSHSHAVLDCLRNRSEWAHLIARGPKTNSSKRRRKTDSDTPTMEETENEEAKTRTSSKELDDKSGDSHREDFPKGKRKARKRRMLKVRGQSEESKKRKRTTSSGSAILSEDDDSDDDEESAGAFSNSSNKGADGEFSEDESHGAVECTVRTEASTSTSSASSR